MVLLICMHFDKLLILTIIKALAPPTILLPHMWFKVCFYVYILDINSCLVFSWELQCLICVLTIKSRCYKRGFMINIRISRGKIWTFFYTEFVKLRVQIFCIWLHKADFIMAYFCSGKRCAHGPLVFEAGDQSKHFVR